MSIALNDRLGVVRTLLLRFCGYGLLPVLAMAAPLAVLPVVSRVAGVGGWAAFGVGQAVGNLLSTVVGFGWSIGGPPKLAAMHSQEEQFAVFRESLSSRLLLGPASVVGGSVVCFYLVPAPHGQLAALTCAAMALTGFSINWFAVGLGRPMLMARYEVGPRVACSLAVMPVLLFTRDAIWYPIALILAVVCGQAAFVFRNRRAFGRMSFSLKEILVSTAANIWTAGISSASNVYNAAPLPISSVLGTVEGTARLGSADKVYRYALIPLSVLGDSLQAWVLEKRSNEGSRRQVLVFVLHVLLGLLVGLVLAFGGPRLSGLLFGSEVRGAADVFRWYGIAYLFTSAAAPIMRNVLVPAGRSRSVLAAVVCACLTGVVAMLWFGSVLGPVGIAGSLALSQGVLVIFLILGVMRCKLGRGIGR